MHNKGCPEEYPITLIVNGYEVAIFQLTTQDLEDWTYGYLFSEGIIENADDIVSIRINEEFGEIHVGLNSDIDTEMMMNKKKHYTAGCGRGVTFFSMTDVKSFDKVISNNKYKLSHLLKRQAEFAEILRYIWKQAVCMAPVLLMKQVIWSLKKISVVIMRLIK